MTYFGFQLGREWKLSIAEIISVFPKANILLSSSGILILENITKGEIEKIFFKLGGTIKVFELELFTNINDIYNTIVALGEEYEGKFKYSLNIFGEKNLKLETILKKTKQILKNKNISARYFNKENGKNLNSAQILGNSILKKGYDFNIVSYAEIFYFGKTLFVQDIDSYSERDFAKETSMQVGMLPPKLCQIMINLGSGETPNSLYDPFVGLGTVLIEAANMGIEHLFGSDINETMVETSSQNLDNFLEKNEKESNFSIIKLNAKFIDEAPFFNDNLELIVTEGYLGEIMTKKNISLERIEKQKESLEKIWEAFFENIKKTSFAGKMVFCVPFWEFKGKEVYFSKIEKILKEKEIKKLPLSEVKGLSILSKQGSLFYKRKGQLVGREIFLVSFS